MRRALLLVLGVLPLLVAACGGDDDDVATPNEDGVVEITMEDIRFEPDEVDVEQGQTVMFEFRNDGEQVHEAYIGTEAQQEAHEMEMNPGGEDDAADHGDDTMDDTTTMPGEEMADDAEADEHGDEPAVTVDPGESASLEYTFDESGRLEIGCHEPGHYEAGMIVTVNVR